MPSWPQWFWAKTHHIFQFKNICFVGILLLTVVSKWLNTITYIFLFFTKCFQNPVKMFENHLNYEHVLLLVYYSWTNRPKVVTILCLLFFLLFILFRSVCHQVWNQTNRRISSSGDYILLSANVSPIYSSGLLQGNVFNHKTCSIPITRNNE